MHQQTDANLPRKILHPMATAMLPTNRGQLKAPRAVGTQYPNLPGCQTTTQPASKASLSAMPRAPYPSLPASRMTRGAATLPSSLCSPYELGSAAPSGSIKQRNGILGAAAGSLDSGRLADVSIRPAASMARPGYNSNPPVPVQNADGTLQCPRCPKTYFHRQHLNRHLSGRERNQAGSLIDQC